MVQPTFFSSEADLPGGTQRIDAFDSALRELFFIEHPAVAKDSAGAAGALKEFIAKNRTDSVWVYYPWKSIAVRIPDETTYYRLRTARNRDLINEHEQQTYRDIVVGVAGLSVGSAAVAALVRTGGPKTLKIADPDTIEISNLNRMNANMTDIGFNKAEIAAREAWELDPFADIRVWSAGITKETLEDFVAGEPRLGVFVDEMDDIALKFASRIICKKMGVPVVMATDNGDGVIVDIERFDTEPDRPIFHGRVEASVADTAKTRADFVAAASQIIDASLFTERQALSIGRIGKTLSGVAQLGSAAAVAGAAVSYAVRRIAAGEPLPSGRYIVGLEAVFSKPTGV